MNSEAKIKYNSHKHYAKQRNISFRLSFDEWVNWWVFHLGPEWLKKRGRGSNQFAMARYGDVGAYEIGNIKCLRVRENIKERKSSHGSKHPRAKIDEKLARCIFETEGSYASIARYYKVSYTTARDIKRGRLWRHIQ